MPAFDLLEDVPLLLFHFFLHVLEALGVQRSLRAVTDRVVLVGRLTHDQVVNLIHKHHMLAQVQLAPDQLLHQEEVVVFLEAVDNLGVALQVLGAAHTALPVELLVIRVVPIEERPVVLQDVHLALPMLDGEDCQHGEHDGLTFAGRHLPNQRLHIKLLAVLVLLLEELIEDENDENLRMMRHQQQAVFGHPGLHVVGRDFDHHLQLGVGTLHALLHNVDQLLRILQKIYRLELLRIA
mmetsp:Transcript_24578/g.62558  ORF Transcript_24578/g.62558 Transcript_24578/m.62558 type:complete len:238 (+) Transcript_24578:427-1140(+)